MGKVESYTPGEFCWVDLTSRDVPAAKRFYGTLFDWAFVDVPSFAEELDAAHAYVMCRVGGHDVCGLRSGAGALWQSYVQVANADASSRKAVDLGATLAAPPADVLDIGRTATVEDPSGARLAFWQPRRHRGAGVRDEPRTVCWYELATRAGAAAKKFYASLFGWTIKDDRARGPGRAQWRRGEAALGGMSTREAVAGDVPPLWLAYFGVSDCDTFAVQAVSLGAKLPVPPTILSKGRRYAVIEDPQGAVFAVASV